MIIVKITILLTMVVVLLIVLFRAWAEVNPLKALVDDYPKWFYMLPLLMFLDVIGIFASVIWFLFFR